MNQPLTTRRATMPLEDMLKGTDDYLNVEKMIEKLAPAQVGQNFRPSDNLMKFLYLFSQQRDAKELFDWLMDLTIRAPYPHISGSFEEAAIAAAKHQARAGIGEVIIEAIAEGKRLIEQSNQRS
ncbi:hypothetical protein M1D80_11835 [Phyllobacteriaceae bacterium JZ32]